MCGRYNVIDSPELSELMEVLGVGMPEAQQNISPGAYGQFVCETSKGRRLHKGMWSMLIERHPNKPGYRPVPSASTFNARSTALGKLPTWKERFKRKRAIIPASGFHEWTGPRGNKQCYNVTGRDGELAFAGLYEFWNFGDEIVPAFTIITLPKHPRFEHIHEKSVPLMLRKDDFDLWLDPHQENTNSLQHLLKLQIRVPLRVTPIQSPQNLTAAGPEEIIDED